MRSSSLKVNEGSVLVYAIDGVVDVDVVVVESRQDSIVVVDRDVDRNLISPGGKRNGYK